MNKIKNSIKKILGPKLYNSFINTIINLLGIRKLFVNTYEDAKLFYKHSMVFKQNTFNKIESKIVLHYHAIEKGFLHNNFRYRFGEDRIRDLIKLLSIDIVKQNYKNSQIAAAYLAMCKYYEKHESDKVDISDFFSREDYELFKKMTTLNMCIIQERDNNTYFNNVYHDFKEFSASRKSVRNFKEDKIPLDTIEKVIELAKNAPSVCNRQPTKVYYLENKEKIDKVLKIQGGLTGYTKEINQLLVVVADRNYFYSIGERNQLYIDGGLFIMNLLYALHYYKIAACPAHWGHPIEKDKQILKVLPLLESEKVLCVVPIGFPANSFKTTLSLRRENDEILKIV
ncbi:nitroreductase family protein [Salegentibacter sp. BDJ18]|uniref:nitroreductase family protein n=1 Tax=Salegentibacter sp. BDJ18 TaxID=2816376 RepID=UPI001AAF2D95|nr:nitroreductase family protein [Salegentibacter sp. BDJ18]MBO2544805.1 nitroreductase family protein [Salegentibacter sp. BDJ18]